MTSHGGASLGQRAARPQVSVGGWNALLCFAAAFVIVICAIGIRSEVGKVLSAAAYPILAILLLAKLFLPERYASFDREATMFWLGGFALLSTAFKSILRNGEVGEGFFAFTAVSCLVAGLPLLIIAQRRAEQRAGLRSDRDLMLTGAALILTAYVAQFLSTFCTSPCAEWPDANLHLSFVMLPLAGIIVVREIQRRQYNDVIPGILVALALMNAVIQPQVRFATVLFFAGTAILVYEVLRRLQDGASIGKFIEPRRSWSGFGAIVMIGFALCFIGVRMNWSSPDVYLQSEAPSRVSMFLLPVALWGFLLIPFLIMVKPPRARALANIAALVLASSAGVAWFWTVQAIRKAAVEPVGLFYGGSGVFAAGILIVIAGITAMIVRGGN